jgi:hypothetical protein
VLEYALVLAGNIRFEVIEAALSRKRKIGSPGEKAVKGFRESDAYDYDCLCTLSFICSPMLRNLP